MLTKEKEELEFLIKQDRLVLPSKIGIGLKDLKNLIEKFVEEAEIISIVIFGSSIYKKLVPPDDVDVCVEIKDGTQPFVTERWRNSGEDIQIISGTYCTPRKHIHNQIHLIFKTENALVREYKRDDRIARAIIEHGITIYGPRKNNIWTGTTYQGWHGDDITNFYEVEAKNEYPKPFKDEDRKIRRRAAKIMKLIRLIRSV